MNHSIKCNTVISTVVKQTDPKLYVFIFEIFHIFQILNIPDLYLRFESRKKLKFSKSVTFFLDFSFSVSIMDLLMQLLTYFQKR